MFLAADTMVMLNKLINLYFRIEILVESSQLDIPVISWFVCLGSVSS